MNFRNALFSYLIALPVFFAVDMLWLAVIAVDFYPRHIGHLLGPVNWTAAGLFYAMFIAGIVLFGVRPGLAAGSVKTAAQWGGLFGFFTYATYDLTNMATLAGWPWVVVMADIAWGIALCATVSAITCRLALRWLVR